MPGWQLCWLWHGIIRYGISSCGHSSAALLASCALLWLSLQAGSGTVHPGRAIAVFLVWQCISVSLSFIVLIVGLPLTMPSPAAVSFAPVFTAAPGRPDPVAAALSQVGLNATHQRPKPPPPRRSPRSQLWLCRLTWTTWQLQVLTHRIPPFNEPTHQATHQRPKPPPPRRSPRIQLWLRRLARITSSAASATAG